MLTISSELKRIAKFIDGGLREHKFYMAREPEDGMDAGGSLSLVIPRVCIGSVPHANFSMYADSLALYQAPYILVGYNEAQYEDDGEGIEVLIQACAYTQDIYDGADGGEAFPDNMGVLDVTGLLEAVMGWIEDEAGFPAEKPFRIGSYADRAYTYPYAFGYLTFQLETAMGTLHQGRFYQV